ncbi:hypothetical protein CSA37_00635 [Candidatus Fermentibacteria bacterium]|nr:MAG: hypothetical protein CSA37_09865 [Candidatus Fermentibacteria bacterium]PIE53704.1 MAG: hypothetical protein CSA37_00635 [Candidatus Fermentibacteria bacterium]
MIPRAAVQAWRKHALWSLDQQVELDLVITRSLIEIFRVPELSERLCFRGGTALYKLHLSPAPRFSEDIDLVQRHPEPIGQTLDTIQDVLNPWLGVPRRKFGEGRATLVYRFLSEDSHPGSLRLKIEINTREHFHVMPIQPVYLTVDSLWFRGGAEVTGYSLPELLGTKLRALYQRKKGRDLFDLSQFISNGNVSCSEIVRCFQRYTSEESRHITRAVFEENLLAKKADPDFRADVFPLLRNGVEWSFEDAFECVMESLVSLLPGEPWQGTVG